MKPGSLKVLLFLIFSAVLSNGQAQQQSPYRLTLHDAIQKALQANLNVLLSQSRVGEAEGALERSRSAALLPRVNAETYANFHNQNLRAFGLSAPGLPIPGVVGPLSNYDARIYAQQNVLDLSTYRTFKANESALEANKLDKHDAGTATGVDVLRAQVQLANDQQALLVAQNDLKQTLLTLAREMGMSPSTRLELAETLQYRALKQKLPDVLLPEALQARADYLSLAKQRETLLEQQRANRARYYPKVSVNGNIGGLGRSIGSMATTGLIQGQVDFTVFDRDSEGEAMQLASRIKRIDAQIADLERGVDQEIRQALLDLDSATEQVDVAGQGQELARRELTLSQDRFQTGTTNNIEVVTAQDALARAEENYIVAVTRHVDAKCALARALGDTEKNLQQFLGN